MLRRWFFNLAYLQKPVWDTGISPPELLEFIDSHPTGRALDLGCGTGTNVITLAKAGWQVIGVDFAWWAIQKAMRKARHSSVRIDLRRDDVTRLKNIAGPFNLILDIGCFHALPVPSHPKYIANVNRLLDSDGTYLLYTFFKTDSLVPGPGVTEDAIDELSQRFTLVHRTDGTDRGIRPSAWLTFKKHR